MLTKFLLTNNFPPSSFYTKMGAIIAYKLTNFSLTITDTVQKKSTIAISDYNITTIDIPKKLFYGYVEGYRRLFKDLTKTNILDLIKNNHTTSHTWEDGVYSRILNNISQNLVFDVSLQGVIDTGGSRMYDLHHGEGVYIESITSSSYKVRGVDGLLQSVEPRHIKVAETTVQKKQVTKWNKVLDTIIAEYEDFVK